jgi:hypothetical protein
MRDLEKEMMNLTSKYYIHISEVIFTCREVLRHMVDGFTFHPKEGVLHRSASLLKFHLGRV